MAAGLAASGSELWGAVVQFPRDDVPPPVARDHGAVGTDCYYSDEEIVNATYPLTLAGRRGGDKMLTS